MYASESLVTAKIAKATPIETKWDQHGSQQTVGRPILDHS